jgi:hypothetical protein
VAVREYGCENWAQALKGQLNSTGLCYASLNKQEHNLKMDNQTCKEICNDIDRQNMVADI